MECWWSTKCKSPESTNEPLDLLQCQEINMQYQSRFEPWSSCLLCPKPYQLSYYQDFLTWEALHSFPLTGALPTLWPMSAKDSPGSEKHPSQCFTLVGFKIIHPGHHHHHHHQPPPPTPNVAVFREKTCSPNRVQPLTYHANTYQMSSWTCQIQKLLLIYNPFIFVLFIKIWLVIVVFETINFIH